MTSRHKAPVQAGVLRWLRPRRSPEALFRRRGQLVGVLVILVLAVVVADHFRHGQPAAPPSTPGAADVARYDNQTYRVTRVVDGDTLHVDAPDGTRLDTVIRLWGVDAPEVHGVGVPAYYGPEASAFAHTAADGRFVRLELLADKTRDRYGRLLAYVYLPDGAMLNERLIELGFAYADTRFAHPRKAKFTRLEKRACQERIGLWAKVTPEQMPAWRRQREHPAVPPSQPLGLTLPVRCPSLLDGLESSLPAVPCGCFQGSIECIALG
jgi:micrococcal nuclease